MDLSEKRCVWTALSVGFTDTYLTLLGMSHPYFQTFETGEEAFLPVAYFLSHHREKPDFDKCALLLQQFVDRRNEGLVLFGIVADVESALYLGFRDKQLLQARQKRLISIPLYLERPGILEKVEICLHMRIVGSKNTVGLQKKQRMQSFFDFFSVSQFCTPAHGAAVHFAPTGERWY